MTALMNEWLKQVLPPRRKNRAASPIDDRLLKHCPPWGIQPGRKETP